MLTIYRGKLPTGGFRVVKGAHDPLPESSYTRTNFASTAEAYAAPGTTDAEREAILRIDPDAATAPGKWVRIDKGDGIETDVSRDEVADKCANSYPSRAVIRRIMSQAESARSDHYRTKVLSLATDFARYEYRRA